MEKGNESGEKRKILPAMITKSGEGGGEGNPFSCPNIRVYIYIYVCVCVSWLFARLRRVLQGFRKGDSLRLLGPLNYRDVG